MAELTTELQQRGGSGGASIPIPSGGGGDGIAAFTSLGSALFGGLADQERNRRAQQQWDFQLGEHKREARIQDGLDEFAQIQFEGMAEVQSRIEQLSELQAGVEQGSVPRARLDIAVRQEVSDLFQRYPEARAEIADAMRISGFQDLMLRDVALATAQEDAAIASQLEMQNTWREAFAASGMDPTGLEDSEQMKIGREMIRLNQEMENARREQELAIRQGNVDNDRRNLELRELEMRTMQSATSLATSFLNPQLRSAHELIQAAGGNTEALVSLRTEWPQRITDMRIARDNMVSEMASVWSPEATEHFINMTDDMMQNVSDLMLGDDSTVALRFQAIEDLATLAEADRAETLSLYYDLTDVFGESMVHEMLAGTNSELESIIGPDGRLALQGELRGYATDATNRYNERLITADRLLSGETTLEDIGLLQAQEMAPIVLNATRTSSRIVAQNGVTPETARDVERFTNSYAQTLTVANAMDDGQANIDQIRAYSTVAFSPDVVTTLDAMMEDENTQAMGSALIQGGRRQAESVLYAALQMNSRERGWSMDTNGFDGVRLNAEGRFEAYVNAETRDAFMDFAATNPHPMMNDARALRMARTARQGDQPSRAAIRQAETLNQVVDYLMHTDQHDERMPVDEATTRSRRLFWATQGQAPMVDRQGNPVRREVQDQAPDQHQVQTDADAAFEEARLAFRELTRRSGEQRNGQEDLNNFLDGLERVNPSDNSATARPALPTSGEGQANLPPGARDDWRGASAAARSGVSPDQIRDAVISMESNELTGYIPTDGSGVTIAAGFDLGQHSPEQIQAMGLSEELTAQLLPFAGLSTRQAVEDAGLDPASLVISEDDARAINDYFVNDHIEVVQSLPIADNLSAEALAVAASLRHWAGSLGNSQHDGKLNINGTNRVWEVLSDENATEDDLVDALIDTLAEMTPGTAAANRVRREIAALRAR